MTITIEDIADSKLKMKVSCKPEEIDTDKATPCEQAALKLIAVIAGYAYEKASKRLTP